MQLPPEPARPPAQRPVMWVLVLVGLWNAGRAVVLWRQSALLLDWQVEPSPVWRVALACFWALACLIVAVAMWRRLSWARWAAPVVVAGYGLTELALAARYASSAFLPVPLLLVGAAVVYALWLLRRPLPEHARH